MINEKDTARQGRLGSPAAFANSVVNHWSVSDCIFNFPPLKSPHRGLFNRLKPYMTYEACGFQTALAPSQHFIDTLPGTISKETIINLLRILPLLR